MVDPQTAEYYERKAVEYAAATASQGMVSSMNRFCDGLPTRSTIIDVGCGGGRDLLEFRNRGYEAVGLDSSTRLATIAADFSGCPVAAVDMAEMPFVSGSFNAAWASASLLHFDIREVTVALAEIRRVLRTGGRFFSSVKRGEGTNRDTTGRRFTYYDPGAWVSLVGNAGFTAIEILREQGEDGIRWIRVLARCS